MLSFMPEIKKTFQAIYIVLILNGYLRSVYKLPTAYIVIKIQENDLP